MTNIGIIHLTKSHKENKSNEYLAGLNEAENLLIILTSENFEKEVQYVETVIINCGEIVEINRICEEIIRVREKTTALLWILHNNCDQIKRSIYLYLGADINITKEYSPMEFHLMFKKICNKVARCLPENESSSIGTNRKSIYLDQSSLTLRINHMDIYLTKLEYRLVEVLYKGNGQTVLYNEIRDYVWKKKVKNEKMIISNLVFQLRKKLKQNRINPQYIRAVRSMGYKLEIDSDLLEQ